MPQFNAESLARVLVQVEREVLVDALEIANLTSILTAPALGTLGELQQFFNLVANIQTFGFEFLEKFLREEKEKLGPVTLSFLTFIIEQFVQLADIGDTSLKVEEKVDEALSELAFLSDVISEIPFGSAGAVRGLLTSANRLISDAQVFVDGQEDTPLRAVASEQLDGAISLLNEAFDLV